MKQNKSIFSHGNISVFVHGFGNLRLHCHIFSFSPPKTSRRWVLWCYYKKFNLYIGSRLTLHYLLVVTEDNARDFISSGGVKALTRISVESSREDIRNLAKTTLKLSPTFKAEMNTESSKLYRTELQHSFLSKLFNFCANTIRISEAEAE